MVVVLDLKPARLPFLAMIHPVDVGSAEAGSVESGFDQIGADFVGSVARILCRSPPAMPVPRALSIASRFAGRMTLPRSAADGFEKLVAVDPIDPAVEGSQDLVPFAIGIGLRPTEIAEIEIVVTAVVPPRTAATRFRSLATIQSASRSVPLGQSPHLEARGFLRCS